MPALLAHNVALVWLHMAQLNSKTTAPVERGEFNGAQKEFGRWQDVERIYSIKRGTAYNLLRDGKIRGVLLRIRGQKSGVRLFDMASVRDFISSQMQESGAI